jgi:hypothetical protein
VIRIAEQNVVVRMSVSSGFRKYRSVFQPLSRLAVAINNHPESTMMKISRAVESQWLASSNCFIITM